MYISAERIDGIKNTHIGRVKGRGFIPCSLSNNDASIHPFL